MKRKKVLQCPGHVRRSSPAWDRDVVECLLKGQHQLYDVPADPSRWMAAWMYLDDVARGIA